MLPRSGMSVSNQSRDSKVEESTGILPPRLSIAKDHHTVVMQMLPPLVRRRVKALKKLQFEHTIIEAEFFNEIHRLECRYHQVYAKLYSKRRLIVTGLIEPTDEECEFSDETVINNPAISDQLRLQLRLDDDRITAKGVPNFWLTIFKNVEILNDMVQPHDEPILRHLQDIQVKFLECDPMGFVLEFHFEQNEYFTNLVLTKRYEMKCNPDLDSPFSFEGPEIYRCRGCTIDWNKGKNVTIKTIKKRQKHRSHGAVRTVTKTVQNDSFFNFFTPPPFPEDETEELDPDTEDLLSSDFGIGHYIRERIVPHAVLYYTGEALEEDEYEEDEESEEDVTSDSEENETVVYNRGSSHAHRKHSGDVGTGAPDCKQQ